MIINFAANTGSTKFTITQKKSLLDSSAVLNDIVRKDALVKRTTPVKKVDSLSTHTLVTPHGSMQVFFTQ